MIENDGAAVELLSRRIRLQRVPYIPTHRAATAFLSFAAILILLVCGCAKPSKRTQVKKEPSEGLGHRSSPAAGNAAPRLAVIVDDMGNDRAADDAALALPYPLTMSVLPHLPLSAQIADAATRRGDEVMLHLPMQPDSEIAPAETIELRPGMPSSEVRSMLAAMLATVPHASGVNNHEGSKATADAPLMDALMQALHERGLFFIDSRTTSSTVAYDVARRYDVRAASRKVFLDDSLDPKAIENQIELAAHYATRGGEAIAIGHPHPQTVEALREMLPRIQRRGVQLVFASDVAH